MLSKTNVLSTQSLISLDKISRDLLLAKLAAYGVFPLSLALLHSYLRDTSQRVRIEDITSEVVVFSKGVA